MDAMPAAPLPAMLRRLLHCAVLAASALLAACAGLPPRGAAALSSAHADQGDTALSRIAAASRPAGETAPSGFRLLPTGEFAFNARTAMARRAERALDVQSYHVHRDQAGRALLRELRDAAARGVRVRLLVDDFYAAEIDDLLRGLAAHDNVQVRLFNPLSMRRGAPVARLLLSQGSFEQMNRRMHNKLFVADGSIAVYGGRNVADEYFMSHPQANFIDMDVLSTGRVVQDLEAAFDSYWNSDLAFPVQALLGTPRNAETARAEFDAEVRGAAPAVPAYRTDPLGQTAVDAQMADGRLALTHASAQVFVDPPDKAAGSDVRSEPTAAMGGLLQAMAAARTEVAIVSPYFVPGNVGMPMMRRAAQQQVRMLLFTNSLGSTDEPLVHHVYSQYRAEMLRLGVEIYEFSPQLTQRSRSFGVFGNSTPRLHAKVTLIDHSRLLVGSVNLDGRSATANTEMGVVIDSPALTEAVSKLMRDDRFASVFKLRLAGDGDGIEWTSIDAGGQAVVSREEPGTSAWQRFKIWLGTLFVEERLL